MKIWIQCNREVLFKIRDDFYIEMPWKMMRTFNKRMKIREVDVVTLGNHYYTSYPSNFVAMYYTENIKYWHELRRLVETVCY